MTRPQKYISLLLERLPKYELRSYEHQTNLDKIRDRISSTENLQTELRTLYQVKGFTDFALSLMWIADKVEKDASLEESTLDEETLVFTKFRQAMGDTTAPVQESTPSATMFDLPPLQGFQSTPTSEPAVDLMWDSAPQTSNFTQPTSGGTIMGNEKEGDFALLLERFLESVQSGNDDRTTLMSDLINGCNKVIADNSAVEEYKKFSQLLVEFLQYISDNQYLDDVRVMNIVSNIQEPFSQWARSGVANRVGMLDQAIDILRDFKTMFE